MTVLGLGCDIVRTARFDEILKRAPQFQHRLCERILHPKEHAEYAHVHHDLLVQRLASSWAAKEALFKSLSCADQQNCYFNEWRVDNTRGRYMLLSDAVRNDHCLLSISHDGGFTMAIVLRQANSES